MSNDKTHSLYAQLTSMVDNVKVDTAGATVPPVADLQIDKGNIPKHPEIAGRLSVVLISNSTDVDLDYVVVLQEDTNIFHIAQLRNPLQAPPFAASANVYVDGEYILSTNITTVPPKGQMELDLGVEQVIKVVWNTTYQETRSGETLIAFNKLRYHIQIDMANCLPKDARIKVRERLPISYLRMS